MVPLLFSPITVGPFELPNRMTVAPMCEYSANDGSASAWHTHQLMNNTMSGAELVMVEATAVERLGRLSHRLSRLVYIQQRSGAGPFDG